MCCSYNLIGPSEISFFFWGFWFLTLCLYLLVYTVNKSLSFLFFYGLQYLEVREKQYDKKAYLDLFTVSFKRQYLCKL